MKTIKFRDSTPSDYTMEASRGDIGNKYMELSIEVLEENQKEIDLRKFEMKRQEEKKW